MTFNNETNLLKSIVELSVKEKFLLNEVSKIEKRYEIAKNLKNTDEAIKIENEGKEISFRIRKFIVEKTIIMTMAIMKLPNFTLN